MSLRVLPGEGSGWGLIAAVVVLTLAGWAGFAAGLYRLLVEWENRHG